MRQLRDDVDNLRDDGTEDGDALSNASGGIQQVSDDDRSDGSGIMQVNNDDNESDASGMMMRA